MANGADVENLTNEPLIGSNSFASASSISSLSAIGTVLIIDCYACHKYLIELDNFYASAVFRKNYGGSKDGRGERGFSALISKIQGVRGVGRCAGN